MPFLDSVLSDLGTREGGAKRLLRATKGNSAVKKYDGEVVENIILGQALTGGLGRLKG